MKLIIRLVLHFHCDREKLNMKVHVPTQQVSEQNFSEGSEHKIIKKQSTSTILRL